MSGTFWKDPDETGCLSVYFPSPRIFMDIPLQWAHHCTVPAGRSLEDLDTYHRSKDILLILLLEQQKHIGQQDSEDICRDQHTGEALSATCPEGPGTA